MMGLWVTDVWEQMCGSLMSDVWEQTGFHTGVGAPWDFPPPQKLSLFYMIMMLCDGSDL